MSVFTNPASGAARQAEAYTKAILELLGDREPFGVLHATATGLRHAIDGLSPEAMSKPESEGKWSIRQVLRHLADSEIVWAWRLRMVMAHDRPTITGYDQDAWAEHLGYEMADARESIEEFEVLRRGNLRLLEPASPADLQRVGVHVERGEESLAHMIRMYAGHDLLHLAQLKRIRAAVA